LIAILRILVVVGGVAGGILFFFKQLAGSGQWRKGISEKDLKLLKQALLSHRSSLVDLDKEELPLLSLKQKRNRVKKNSKKLLVGAFQSIYQENLLSYAVMNYQHGHHLIVAQTTEQEFVYRVKNKSTDIYVNGSHIGHLDGKGLLSHPVNKNTIAEIDISFSPKYQDIKKADKSIGAVLNPLVKYGDHERALQNLELQNDDDKLILLSLTFLNMIERTQ